MTRTRLLGAASLGLLLAACGNETPTDTAAGTGGQRGELPATAQTAPSTAYPSDTVAPAATPAPPPAETTSADASAMGDPAMEGREPVTGADTPVQDLRQQTETQSEDPAREMRDSASPPPPVQR